MAGCVSDAPAGWTGRKSSPAEKRSDRPTQDTGNWEKTAASEERAVTETVNTSRIRLQAGTVCFIVK